MRPFPFADRGRKSHASGAEPALAHAKAPVVEVLSNVPGPSGSSLLMFLVVSMLNSYGFGAGAPQMLTGEITTGIFIAASARRAFR
ncbi:hypothetical protein [Amaricoccus macauensis]|uniref:hypothetical protein n=1 Tax=Amaricoccus macauensis TaxID=57001 RepID=UPI003C79ADA4